MFFRNGLSVSVMWQAFSFPQIFIHVLELSPSENQETAVASRQSPCGAPNLHHFMMVVDVNRRTAVFFFSVHVFALCTSSSSHHAFVIYLCLEKLSMHFSLQAGRWETRAVSFVVVSSLNQGA